MTATLQAPAPTREALIQATAARLHDAGVALGQGTLDVHDEAAWLVLWALGLRLDEDIDLTAAVTEPEAERVEALVSERIRSRKPTAYLTGEAWLQGVPFHVDERVIIPRSFIAELLGDEDYGAALDTWLSERTHRVLDLCTGNGSLAVLAAMAFPDVTVDALDLSTDALAVARINVDRHGLTDRIRLLQGDGLSGADGRYDLILCNPPYVNTQSMDDLPAEFRAEPELALAGGTDGMDFIRPLLAQAPEHLSDEGVLVLEIGNERAHFETAFPRLEVVWLETSAGHDQVLLVTRQALVGLGSP